MDAQEKLRQLLAEYSERERRTNKSFSLRNLATMLDVSAGNLSLFLAGKKNFSLETLEDIGRKITQSPEERKDLLAEINRLYVNTRKKTFTAAAELDATPVSLSKEEFLKLDEWYHYAIRMLLSLESVQYDPKWMAKKLGISVEEAESALKTLFKLNLIKLAPDGRIVRTMKHLRTPDSVAKDEEIHAVKVKIHRQHIEHAMYSLENHDPSARDVTWVNIPSDSKQLERARELIRKLQDDLITLLENEKTDSIYRLTVQLCPLEK